MTQNKTQAERLKGNFLCERAAYLFNDNKCGRKINMHHDKRSLINNINQIVGGQTLLHTIIHLMFPTNTYTEAIEDPLDETDYMKLNKESVKDLLELKNKVEYKMNEKFIEKGFKIKQKDYMKYLDKIC
mmetsp:Transcript_16386/g.14313  ORF Transcript_16386/g.14313 Transcript_16386/m.14313 type:complete len:129 (-) Transcript_16386:591-977(-)